MSLANVNQPNQIYHITAKQSKQASKQSKEVTERVFVLLRHSLSDEPTSELPFPVDYDPPCLANFIVVVIAGYAMVTTTLQKFIVRMMMRMRRRRRMRMRMKG